MTYCAYFMKIINSKNSNIKFIYFFLMQKFPLKTTNITNNINLNIMIDNQKVVRPRKQSRPALKDSVVAKLLPREKLPGQPATQLIQPSPAIDLLRLKIKRSQQQPKKQECGAYKNMVASRKVGRVDANATMDMKELLRFRP